MEKEAATGFEILPPATPLAPEEALKDVPENALGEALADAPEEAFVDVPEEALPEAPEACILPVRCKPPAD